MGQHLNTLFNAIAAPQMSSHYGWDDVALEMDVVASSDKSTMSSSIARQITMEAIVAQANAGMAVDEIQRTTYKYIMDQATPDDRLVPVTKSLEVASTGSESLSAIAMEVWALLGQKSV